GGGRETRARSEGRTAEAGQRTSAETSAGCPQGAEQERQDRQAESEGQRRRRPRRQGRLGSAYCRSQGTPETDRRESGAVPPTPGDTYFRDRRRRAVGAPAPPRQRTQ